MNKKLVEVVKKAMCKNAKMKKKAGPGAGYKLEIDNIYCDVNSVKIKSVVVRKEEENVYVHFEATISPQTVNAKAKGYDWTVEKEVNITKGDVDGTWTGDLNDFYEEDEIENKTEIEMEKELIANEELLSEFKHDIDDNISFFEYRSSGYSWIAPNGWFGDLADYYDAYYNGFEVESCVIYSEDLADRIIEAKEEIYEDELENNEL